MFQVDAWKNTTRVYSLSFLLLLQISSGYEDNRPVFSAAHTRFALTTATPLSRPRRRGPHRWSPTVGMLLLIAKCSHRFGILTVAIRIRDLCPTISTSVRGLPTVQPMAYLDRSAYAYIGLRIASKWPSISRREWDRAHREGNCGQSRS
jgi:hypothetical protein